MGYKRFLRDVKGTMKDFIEKKLPKGLSDKVTPKMLENIEKISKDKKEFIEFYRRMNGLYLDKDVFRAIDIKTENEIKSIQNNPRCANKKRNIEQIKRQRKELIGDFKELSNDSNTWKN